MTVDQSPWERPIFIASMGRSGSTLLQRLLNVHPDVTIWGEHGGFLSGILSSYEVTLGESVVANLEDGFAHRHSVVGELSDKEVFKPWVSPFRSGDLGGLARQLILDLFTRDLPESVRWGFKEIRYSDTEFRTLMRLFPDAHVVVLARDVLGYAQSRFFAFGNTSFDLETVEGQAAATKRVENMIGGWVRRYEGLVRLQDDFPGRTSTVAYGDLVPGHQRVDSLIHELGEPPLRRGAADEVLIAVSGSSYKHNSKARSNRSRLEEIIASADLDREKIALLSQRLGLS